MEVKTDFDNKLLGRREVKVVIPSAAGKTRFQIKSDLAKKYKAEEDLIVVESIRSHYGNSDVMVEANIYESKETLDKLTAKHMVKRNTAPVAEAEE